MEYTEKELVLYKEYLTYIKRYIVDILRDQGFITFIEGIDFVSIKKNLKNREGDWIFNFRATDGDTLLMEDVRTGKFSGISFQKYMELKKRDDRDKKLKELGI